MASCGLQIIVQASYLEDDRLVKVVADELATIGKIGWWDDYDRLVNKYALDEEECTSSVRG